MVENSSSQTFSPILYPWGFPILLTPIYFFRGLDYESLKTLESFFLVGAFFIMFLIFFKRKKLTFAFAFFFLILIAFSPIYIESTNSVLPDIPFMFFSYSALYFIISLLKKEFKIGRWYQFVFVGVFLFFCFTIRTEGIILTLVLSIGFINNLYREKLYKKNESWICIGFFYLSFFTLYNIVPFLLPIGYTSHLGYKRLVNLDSISENVMFYFDVLKMQIFETPLFYNYFIYIVGILIIIGILKRLVADFIFVIYMFSFIFLFLIWPFAEPRYLYSIYPMLLYFYIQGIVYLLNKLKKSFFVTCMVISILSSHVVTNIYKTYLLTAESKKIHFVIEGPESEPSKEMFNFIKTQTKNTDIIAFFKPRVMHFYTGRISLAVFDDVNQLKQKVNYIVEHKQMGSYFQIPLSRSYSNINIELIFLILNSIYTM